MNDEFPEEWSTIKRIEFLIEEQVDGYASSDYDSYYPSIKQELIPKIRSLIAKDKVKLLEELEDLIAPGHERNT